MKLLGIDFETTGTVVETDRVVEIGAVLWDTDRKVPLQVLNQLIKHDPSEKVSLTQEIQDLTHILPHDLKDCGISPINGFAALVDLFSRCDYVVAHNGNNFDKPLYEAETVRLGLGVKAAQCKRPWLDTRTDVPYPREMIERGMNYLSTQHKITNPYPHRAVFDVMTMLQMISGYDIQAVIALSTVPMILIRALVGFENKDKAKARCFRWEPGTKSWIKSIKESHFDLEKAESGFDICVVQPTERQRT